MCDVYMLMCKQVHARAYMQRLEDLPFLVITLIPLRQGLSENWNKAEDQAARDPPVSALHSNGIQARVMTGVLGILPLVCKLLG